jgi:hypothetical protein
VYSAPPSAAGRVDVVSCDERITCDAAKYPPPAYPGIAFGAVALKSNSIPAEVGKLSAVPELTAVSPAELYLPTCVGEYVPPTDIPLGVFTK